jgi:hypothetical protein
MSAQRYDGQRSLTMNRYPVVWATRWENRLMRILLHYLFAVSVLTLYGGQV